MKAIKHTNILIALHQQADRALIRNELITAGYTVCELSQTTELITLLNARWADAVIMDCNFPAIESQREQLPGLFKANATPLIVICKRKDARFNHFFEWGVDDIVLKPMVRSELLAKIKKLLNAVNEKRKILESQNHLEALLHHCPIAIAYTDLELNVLKSNAQFTSRYGYGEDIGKLTRIMRYSPLKIMQSEPMILQKIKNETCFETEIATFSNRGVKKLTHIRAKPVDLGAKARGWVWTFEDSQVQQVSIDESIPLTSVVFEILGEALVIFNESDRIIKANPAMLNLLGYSISELQQITVTDLFENTYNAVTLSQVLEKVKLQYQWKGELWLAKKNTEVFPASIVINCIKLETSPHFHFVALVSDISKRKELEMSLRYRADHDPLTGLPNRNTFFLKLNEDLAIAKRQKYTIAVLFLDLDGFKNINDTLGHGRGDEILQQVAVKLQHCVREVDTIARLGGDEFVIILNGTSVEWVNETAQRLIRALNMRLEESLTLSASIGIAMFPDDSDNPHKLLQYADHAMYVAKKQGKHTYCWHNAKI